MELEDFVVGGCRAGWNFVGLGFIPIPISSINTGYLKQSAASRIGVSGSLLDFQVAFLSGGKATW